MFPKRFLLLLLLLAAIGLPFLLSDGGLGKLKEKWNSFFAGSSTPDAPFAALDAGEHPGASYIGNAAPAQLTGPKVTELGQVFHFGVTPDWIAGRWSRVTTAVGDLELDGLRVALLTGPRNDDLHGSLTYYFNQDAQLERIRFRGYTGDAARVVRLVTEHYGFQQFPGSVGGLYLKRWNGKPKGVLLVEYAPVIQANSPRSRLQVTLEINNTLGRYQLSRETTALLKQRGLK